MSKKTHIQNRRNGHNRTSLETLVEETRNDLTKTGDTAGRIAESRSRAEYYQRVATYSPVTWLAKPFYLSPLVCSRFGWQNVDIDMLQCTNCKAFLCGQLPKNADSQTYKDTFTTLKKNLTESHDKLCKWISSPSPESFSQVPYHRKEELYTDFCNRVASLYSIDDQLPEIAYHSMKKYTDAKAYDDNLQDIIVMIKTHLTEMNIECSENAIIYSLFGWDLIEITKDLRVLQCKYCCSKRSVCNKKSKRTNDAVPDGSPDEPSLKKTKLDKVSFDPIAGHRYWCPWLQTTTAENQQSSESPVQSPIKSSTPDSANSSPVKHDSDSPAWLHVARMLSRHKQNGLEGVFCQQIKQSPKNESLQHIRQILRSCASPNRKVLKLSSKAT